jgi:hypothetical protein
LAWPDRNREGYPRVVSKSMKFAIAKSSTASILQRFIQPDFSMAVASVGFRVFGLSNQLSFARIAGLMKAAFE